MSWSSSSRETKSGSSDPSGTAPAGSSLSECASVASRAPAEPPTLSAAVPNWKAGDTIHLEHRTVRVVGKRDDEADQPPVLIVEDENRGISR